MKRWLAAFTLVSTGLTVFVVVGLWMFSGLDLSLDGYIAITLGIVITTALTIGLMALSFYSDRSHHDQNVQLKV